MAKRVSGILSKVGSKFLALIRNQDIYGKQVQLTYKGEDTIKTTFGGLISIIGKCLVIYILYTQFVMLFERGANTAIHQRIDDDIIEHGSNMPMTSHNFQIGTQLITNHDLKDSEGGAITNLDRYLRIQFVTSYVYWDDGVVVYGDSPMYGQLCDQENFSLSEKAAEKYQRDEYMCRSDK
jgi:hypothetical protein